MRITVFGATGGIGQEVVGQALAAGHEVTAVVRDPDRLPASLDRAALHAVVRLDDPAAVRAAVAGRDAVLSGLGSRGRKANGVAERLTGRIVSAMEAEGVRRLLVVSASPVGPEPADDPLVDRLMRRAIGAVLAELYADLARMEAALARSATDWTSVRPPKLTDGACTGVYRKVVGGTPRSGRSISRADVAHAMLALIDDPAAVKQGVGVAY
ncbi:NAD(P)H-binding protein [Streptomyces sp. ATCC51928]|uniref:NAD(P)-dependent oxidoreductase n=1 Tax=Streptomyces caviscabies TaxID=90079 RepID=A0ABW2MH97_9ACTN|nr:MULTISPECIES: NAD(P)H-binding protein [unclassified Streptomyces]MCL6287242.1 SDR family oxidoreductase [Streptomyces sp. 43Y-GA-1]MDX3504909.1 NAD(P)H-binding protein [Streptomyces sp. ATCC51928]MDX5519196.1 NAD(P)H-binding protein [Streptomyces sp. DE06-01C]QXQ98817.1 SDR family oxidoreductase [Streptomyces sp. WY228]